MRTSEVGPLIVAGKEYKDYTVYIFTDAFTLSRTLEPLLGIVSESMSMLPSGTHELKIQFRPPRKVLVAVVELPADEEDDDASDD